MGGAFALLAELHSNMRRRSRPATTSSLGPTSSSKPAGSTSHPD